MLYIIIGIVLIGIVAAIAGAIRNRKLQRMLERGEISELPEIKTVESEECCGQHEVCESDSLYAAVSQKIEYYDDEDLDRYIGTASDEYTTEVEEEFREILYSLQERDVAGWLRSLYLREIEVPDGLKDEALLIVGERRQ